MASRIPKKIRKAARGFFVLEGDINLKEESKAIAEDFEKSIKKSARRLIVATAIKLDLPLITADDEITDSRECRVFWS